MPEWLYGVISGVITGGGIGFIQFLITRHDNKKKAKEEKESDKIAKRLDKAERDNVRLQMLVLMKLFPDGEQEVLKCAEHYFKELKGNWYMTSIFNKWLIENKVAKPEWLDDDN